MKRETWPEAAQHGRSWVRLHSKQLLLAAGGLLVAIAVVSCATNRVLFAPPQIPGATFVGSDECAQCHGEIEQGIDLSADHAQLRKVPEKAYLRAQKGITTDFKTADHAGLQIRGEHPLNVGCEACHGPGSIHAEAGGGPNTIINPRKSPEVCYQCHGEKQGQFNNLPYHHPIMEGKVSCSDCHNPHKGPLVKSGGVSLAAGDATCYRCHVAQQGPYVFEHEAMREGCVTCHDPHGSVNAKLLRQRNANLCLKCHLQQRTQTGVIIGGYDHGANLARGTCWTAGCHEAVHGSQVSRSLRF
jgi:DmsE family decaheme c-type cytochrome